jgi:hypothetical protein
LSPNTDPGRFSVVASEACQTSSRQLNLDDAFGALALVRDDWKAQALGNELNLTESVRRRLNIRTIGAVDMTPEERK